MIRRGKIDIIAEILLIARRGSVKTKIAHLTNLNFKRCEKYLALLLKKGLLTVNDDRGAITYVTTEKGHEFLELYRRYKELLGE